MIKQSFAQSRCETLSGQNPITIANVCRILNVDTPNNHDEWFFEQNLDYIVSDEETGDLTEDSQEFLSYNSDKYRREVLKVAEELFEQHAMTLVPVEGNEDSFLVEPATTRGWRAVCQKLIATINGYGMFHFSSVRELVESGPYKSLQDAAMQHLHWMGEYYKVYGEVSPERQIERAMRY